MRRPGGRHARAHRGGFTLLELLVAIAVFAVVATLAWRGLDVLARGALQLDEAAGRLARVQRGIDLLARDVRQAVDRPVRDAEGRPLAALLGEAHALELTRAGHGNALAQPRAELERVRWRRVDEALVRERWPVLDRGDRRAPTADPLLDGVTALDLRYFGSDGRSHASWPPPRSTDAGLPRAVELRVTLADYRELRRVLELTAPAGPAPPRPPAGESP